MKQARRKDVTELVNACDAGREGELIFRLIEQYAGGKTPLGKPVRRLWLQSMTPQAIRDGFEALRTNEQMHGLADAARSRSEADWLVGINGTRAMTAFNSRDGGFFLTTVGRVQTPTLAVVVEREERIRKFVSRDYWEIHATFRAAAGDYPGKWFDPKWKKNEDDGEIKADRVWSEREAAAIADAVRGQAAVVTEESKPTTQASPLLFDLTSLQREANGRFGFSAKGTLSIAQSLYERHKALTYPRTDSRALPEDYLPVAQKTFQMLAKSGMPHLAIPREDGARQRLHQAEPPHLRQRQGQRSLRDHPDARGAEGSLGSRAEALRSRRAPLHVGVLPVGGIPGHDPDLAAAGAQLQDRGQGAGQARAGSRSTGRKRRTRTTEGPQSLVPVTPG